MPSRTRTEDLEIDEAPTTIDPYETLGLDHEASLGAVKSAYRKAALKYHPDKASAADKDTAHHEFQEIAFAYAILSDERRRKRYDTTGRTEESVDLEDDDFDWATFYREQYKDVVTSETVDKFANDYKGSDEERTALLQAYGKAKGNMTKMYEQVMVSNPAVDDERFRKIINEAIAGGEVQAFDKFTQESAASIQKRIQKAEEEAAEADEHAKDIGLDKKGKKSKAGKDAGMGDLAAMIRQRQQGRSESFFDRLEEKYAPGEKKGKKRASPMNEPTEEAFEKNAKKSAKKAKAK